MMIQKMFRTIEGHKPIWRLSRWITIRNDIVSERHPLWYYTEKMDDDPKHGYLDWFRWDGRKWAIEQFWAFGCAYIAEQPPQFYEKKKLVTVHAVDMDNIFNPIMIELDAVGEHVRVYREG